MIRLIEHPVEIHAAGQPPKVIREFVGRANSGDQAVSIALMESPAGWSEPPQTPEFDEYTLVLSGTLRVETDEGILDVAAGQTVAAAKGTRVRYSTPCPGGARYVAVCVPAFSTETVHRDEA